MEDKKQSIINNFNRVSEIMISNNVTPEEYLDFMVVTFLLIRDKDKKLFNDLMSIIQSGCDQGAKEND